MKDRIELLSPAKDFEHGVAAINCGADAVYIGYEKFGARQSAGNDINQIAALCVYAAKYNARVYATLNTILYDNELEAARSAAYKLYEAGVSAFIVQDMSWLMTELPDIPLFASTQTHNYDIDRIKFLEQSGFSRVILARELSREQTKEIRANTKLELESFVHGALCVCFSGQCYMSQYIGGRSGNRGECAQPCRKKYDLLDGNGTTIIKDRYLLSLKDMNLSARIAELLDCGITSFKIEGRLKGLSYVKNVTAYYRNVLDSVLAGMNMQKSSSGKTKLNFVPDLEKTFNRGYTEYIFSGERDNIASFDSPKSKGKYIGKVESNHANYFIINTDEFLVNGDGLCYLQTNGELNGFYINKIECNRVYTSQVLDIQEGTAIYRNYDKEFETAVEKENAAERTVEIDFILYDADNGYFLKINDEDGVVSELNIITERVVAENIEKAEAGIIKSLSKLGGTMFSLGKIVIEAELTPFIPMSLLNSARREIVELHEAKRVENFRREKRKACEIVNYPYLNPDYKLNVSNGLAKEFYTLRGVDVTQPAFEIQEPREKVLMTTKHCIRHEIGECPLIINGTKPVPLYIRDGANNFKLEFDCKKCEMKVIGE